MKTYVIEFESNGAGASCKVIAPDAVPTAIAEFVDSLGGAEVETHQYNRFTHVVSDCEETIYHLVIIQNAERPLIVDIQNNCPNTNRMVKVFGSLREAEVYFNGQAEAINNIALDDGMEGATVEDGVCLCDDGTYFNTLMLLDPSMDHTRDGN